MTKVKVSVVQCGSRFSDTQGTLNDLEEWTAEVSAAGSKVAVFPEAYLGGYPKNSSFGCTVGNRDPAGREEYLQYHKSSINLLSSAGPTLELDRLVQISNKYNVFLVVGAIEKEGGSLFCTVAFVHPLKGYVGKHRKLMPTASERLIWSFGHETTIYAVESDLVEGSSTKVTAAICWENYSPLLRQHYYNQGVSLYCVPTVDSRPAFEKTMQHIALEGHCFVLCATQYAVKSNYPKDHAAQSYNTDEVILGGSMIINPLGEVLAGPLRGEKGVLTAEIDLDDILRGKLDLDVASPGHYSLSHVFQLDVKGH